MMLPLRGLVCSIALFKSTLFTEAFCAAKLCSVVVFMTPAKIISAA